MQETIQADAVQTEEKKKSKHFLFWLVPLLVAAAAYLGGVAFFSQNFLPNTTINGQSIGGKTVTAVNAIQQVLDETASLSLVTLEEETQEIKLTDFSYQSQYDSDLDALRGTQSPFLWPLSFFSSQELEVPVAVTYDEAALAERLKALPCFTGPGIQAPVDAHIEKTRAGFAIVEAVPGNMLDYDTTWQVVTETLNAGDLKVDLAGSGCYRQPAVQADDPGLNQQMATLKKYNHLKITIDLTDATEELTYTELKDWLETDGQTIYVDSDAVQAYVTGLSTQYNTYETVRTFHATGVGDIRVGASGLDTYGFQLHISKTQNVLMDAINALESTTVSAVWRIPALCRGTANGDIGSTYIEADLTRQHFWYYRNGTLQLESDFVSGLDSQPGRRTPTGVFRVWGKQRDRTLKGEDYESFVSYWMPFTWTGCGLHDAPWRGAFGGSIYKSNGSHGCLNLPSGKAAALYNAVAYDTPVIVYRS